MAPLPRARLAALTMPRPPGPTSATIRLLDGLGVAATLLCPLFLLHGRGIAEALIDIVAVAFLLRSGFGGDWRWLRASWVPVGLLWWGWLTVCSIPVGPFGAGGWRGLAQAVFTLRFVVFAAALQHRMLAGPGPRRLLRWLLAAACLYIAAQMLLQQVTGLNLFGDPRYGDGTLTGPYDKPRAAAPLSRLLLPVTLVASAWLAQRAADGVSSARRWLWRLGLPLPLLAGIAMTVLAGQRMPLLLLLLGLLVSGLLLRRLRPPLLVALVAAPLLVAASAFVSPGSFRHLVLLFGRQLHHFGQSPYGLIYARALSIGIANPLTGLGFDGFRNGCADPAYFQSWPPWGNAAGEGGGAGICVQHAHNHYLQALTDAGLPGLVLFCAMIGAWLIRLSHGLLRPNAGAGGVLLQAWRVGLFAAVLANEWPFASASAFTNMPLGGWLFLLLGAGLAEVEAASRVRSTAPQPGPEPGPAPGPRTGRRLYAAEPQSETHHG